MNSENPLADDVAPRPILAERTVFRGRVFDMVSRDVDLGEAGGVVTREFVKHPGAVAIVAFDGEGRVLLIRQYRVPVGAYLWEIPAGLLDGGPEETLLAAAQRELAEEADLAAARWDVLADITSTPGGNDEVLRLFLARDLTPVTTDFVREGEEADLQLRWVPLEEALDAVLAGRMANATAGIALLATDRAVRTDFRTVRSVDAAFALRPGLNPA